MSKQAANGHRFVGVRVADTHSLRAGKVWSWIGFSIGEQDLDRRVKVCGKLEHVNPEFLLGRRAA